MTKRVATLGIIVEDPGSVGVLNSILHEYAASVLGRMGIPVREMGISVINIALFDTNDVISSLSGKIGRLSGVNCKVTYSSLTKEC